jgi:hypothetical protein
LDPHFTLVVDKEENLSIGQAIPDSSSFAARNSCPKGIIEPVTGG